MKPAPSGSRMHSSKEEVRVAESERTISHGEDRCLSRAECIEPARKNLTAQLLAGDDKLTGGSE